MASQNTTYNNLVCEWLDFLPITLFEDNKSAIMFADHPGDHRTTKHIDTEVNFASEADGMTIALPSSLFQSIYLDHYLHRFEFEPHW